MSKAQYDIAFGIALVLLIIVLFINFLTKSAAATMSVGTKDGRKREKIWKKR
jgi:ABC-type phosphate transport system permease subunit